MQQLRFKIKSTEAGAIDILPVEDGIEIIFSYGEKNHNYKSTPVKEGGFKGRNPEILKNFCSKMRECEDTDLKELKKFYEFYCDKAAEWKGLIKPEKLWERWMETAK